MAKTAQKKTASETKAKKTQTKKAPSPKKKKVVVAEAETVGVGNRRVDKVCKIASCKRGYKAKGYCKFHYKEWRHGKFGVARYKPCKDMNCFKPMALNRHGFCEEHFQNYYVKGVEQAKAPAPAKPTEKPAEKEASSA
jgi:hypothetical protein